MCSTFLGRTSDPAQRLQDVSDYAGHRTRREAIREAAFPLCIHFLIFVSSAVSPIMIGTIRCARIRSNVNNNMENQQKIEPPTEADIDSIARAILHAQRVTTEVLGT